MANTATFRIRSVKCRDEMGGSFREKFGNDEIMCAVFSADLRGSTKNSGRVNIYENFDDGDIKTFDPPKEVVTLDLAGATGDVELAFSVILIESQLREGDGLRKAFQTFVTLYEEQLKDKLKGKGMSSAQARAIAVPGYLGHPDAGRFYRARGRPVLGRFEREHAVRPDTASVAAHPTTGSPTVRDHRTGAADAANAGAGAADAPTPADKKSEAVGDAFVAALITAVALYAVKFAGGLVSALIDWSQDKFFPPVAIKAKIDASSPAGTVPPNGAGKAEFRGHDGIYEMDWDIVVR